MEQFMTSAAAGRAVVPKNYVILAVEGRPQAYTPERTSAAEEAMRWAMRGECSTPLTGPLELVVSFRFRRPQSWPKADRDAVDGGANPWYTGKPDLDNLVKLVKDAGNGILWLDDKLIVRLEAVKVYAAEDQTVINVFQVEAA